MRKLYTRAELVDLKCPNGCDDHPIVLYCKQHPGQPVIIAYTQSGVLTADCAVCSRPVASFLIAREQRTIHILHHGRTICGMSGEPRDWPSGHEWASLPDADNANCEECRAGRRVLERTAERTPSS